MNDERKRMKKEEATGSATIYISYSTESMAPSVVMLSSPSSSAFLEIGLRPYL